MITLFGKDWAFLCLGKRPEGLADDEMEPCRVHLDGVLDLTRFG
jgi:hypothetical protein